MAGRRGISLGGWIFLVGCFCAQLLGGTAAAGLPCKDYLNALPPQWNLKVAGWSIYAVREEVRKFAEGLNAQLQEDYSRHKPFYYEVSGDNKYTLVTWRMRVQVAPGEKNSFVGQVSLKPDRKAPYFQRFEKLETSDLEEFGLNVGRYLGSLIRMTERHSEEEITKAFRDYRRYGYGFTYDWHRKRPIDLNHSQRFFDDYLDERDESKIQAAIDWHCPSGFLGFGKCNDQWAQVAHKTLSVTMAKYVSYESGELENGHPYFIGSFWYPDGNAYHILLEDVKKGIPTRMYGLGTNRGFVTSLTPLHLKDPVMYIYREALRGGAVFNIRSSVKQENYYANIPYPQTKDFSGLREVVKQYAKGLSLNFREVSFSANGPYVFELIVPGTERMKAHFREQFEIIRYDDETELGYSMWRQVIFDNPYTGEKAMNVTVPFNNLFAIGRSLKSFDSIFEEVSQVLGDFVAVTRDGP